jgi:hypothetical protein
VALQGAKPALSWAAENGHARVVRLLCEQHANVNAADLVRTRNRLAAAPRSLIVPPVVTPCAALGSHARLLSPAPQIGFTPLHWAAENGRAGCARVLLEHRAQTEALCKRGFTPLAWAAFRGHLECVQLLVENGAQLEDVAPEQKNHAPLQLAAMRGHAECVRFLVQAGANLYADGIVRSLPRRHTHVQALFHALFLTDASCAPQLGNTPLHTAAWYGHEACVRALVEHGASTEATNDVRAWRLTARCLVCGLSCALTRIRCTLGALSRRSLRGRRWTWR